MTVKNANLKEVIEGLNVTILSMAAKQQLFDNLGNDIFSMEIYTDYIDILININLKLMNLSQSEHKLKKKQYEKLIRQYIISKKDKNEPEKLIHCLETMI